METVYDIVIVGAGPAGLEAALQAQLIGKTYLLLEAEAAGSLIWNTMAEKKFLHVYGRNTATLRGALPFPDRLLGRELVALWREEVQKLSYKEGVKVERITKTGDVFRLESQHETFRGKQVILTSGTFENHRTLGVPGEEHNPNLFYTYDYYQDYHDKTALVVGGGNSALETAINLADFNKVTLIVRKPAFAANVAQNNLDTVTDLIAAEKVTVRFETELASIGEKDATLKNGEPLPYDLLFVHAGFVQPAEFLESLGIEVREGKAVFNEKFETRVPGLSIAGSLTGADSVIESANQAFAIVNAI